MKYLKLYLLASVVAACTPSPKEIVYGQDNCHYCKMHIVDQQHATEIVTKKGKVFVFDAIECMLNEMEQSDTSEYALYMTNTFLSPGELYNARKVTYIISESIPSPMGMNLTAFENFEDAERAVQLGGGDTYDWRGVQKVFLK